jgi:hypothetical protein
VRRLSAAFLFLTLAANAHAEWIQKNSRDEDFADDRVLYRHVDLQDSDSEESAIVDLAIFSAKSCRLRVIDNRGGANKLMEAMRLTNCVVAVNGGYFDRNFVPLGLRIVDGKITSRLSGGRLMSGVLASNGSVQILRLAEFSRSKRWNTAVESGPFLVDLARPVRGLEATRSARRTFAAIGSGDRAALGYCPGATLSALGKILAIPLGDFKIQRALNLDGGSSSAFYFNGKRGLFLYPEEKPVRDFVGLVAR